MDLSLDFFCSAASFTIGVRSEGACLVHRFFGSANVLGVIVQSARNGFLLLIRVVHVAKWFTFYELRFFLFRKLLHLNLEFRRCLLMFSLFTCFKETVAQSKHCGSYPSEIASRLFFLHATLNASPSCTHSCEFSFFTSGAH